MNDIKKYKMIKEIYLTGSGGFWVAEENSTNRIVGTVALKHKPDQYKCDLFKSKDIIEVKVLRE